MKTPPADYENVGNVYSNFDHQIDEEVSARLAKGHVVAEHTAWDFFALIWMEDGKFYEMVKRYQRHVDTVEGDGALEVIRATNEKYGSG